MKADVARKGEVCVSLGAGVVEMQMCLGAGVVWTVAMQVCLGVRLMEMQVCLGVKSRVSRARVEWLIFA